MPVFVVVARDDSAAAAREEIEGLPSDSVYQLAGNSWLVDYDGTTRALAEHLKIRGEDRRDIGGIVFPITNYSGRFSTDVWEWLKLHMERGSD